MENEVQCKLHVITRTIRSVEILQPMHSQRSSTLVFVFFCITSQVASGQQKEHCVWHYIWPLADLLPFIWTAEKTSPCVYLSWRVSRTSRHGGHGRILLQDGGGRQRTWWRGKKEKSKLTKEVYSGEGKLSCVILPRHHPMQGSNDATGQEDFCANFRQRSRRWKVQPGQKSKRVEWPFWYSVRNDHANPFKKVLSSVKKLYRTYLTHTRFQRWTGEKQGRFRSRKQ